jgi:glycosyltransferase A (GT-A) superfamily protein (DUF2064 family)
MGTANALRNPVLARPGDRVVLGSALDGGYCLLGVKAEHRGAAAHLADLAVVPAHLDPTTAPAHPAE